MRNMGQDQSTCASPKTMPQRVLSILSCKSVIGIALEDFKEALTWYKQCEVMRTCARESLDESHAFCLLFERYMTACQTTLFKKLEEDMAAATKGKRMRRLSFNADGRGNNEHDMHPFVIKEFGRSTVESMILSNQPVPIEIETAAGAEAGEENDAHGGDTMEIAFSGAMFGASFGRNTDYVLRKLGLFHRSRLTSVFTEMAAKSTIALPLSLSDWEQLVRQPHCEQDPGGATVQRDLTQFIAAHHGPLLSWYLEYLHTKDISMTSVLERWPFHCGETHGAFEQAWRHYYQSESELEKITASLIQSRHTPGGSWQCAHDPFFQTVWQSWKDAERRCISLEFLPHDLATLFVRNKQEKIQAEEARLASLDEERRSEKSRSWFAPRTAIEVDDALRKGQREVQEYVGKLVGIVLSHKSLYNADELKQTMQALLQFASVPDGEKRHEQLVAWCDEYVSDFEPEFIIHNFLSA